MDILEERGEGHLTGKMSLFMHFRVVMKNVSDFFRTTAVNKLEFHDDWDERREERIQLLARGDKTMEKVEKMIFMNSIIDL